MPPERETGRLVLGPGSLLIFKVDDSLSSDAINRQWSEVHYDGKEDSWVPSIPAHWHKYHDENMQVLKGRVEFMAEGKTTIAKAGDDILIIPRMHSHSFKLFKGEATIFKEFTNPIGDFKEMFFEDLFDDGNLNFVAAMRAAYYGDTYYSMPGNFKLLEQAVTIAVGGVAAYFWPQKNKGMLAESAAKSDVTAS